VTISETSISFQRAGGHRHDGINSSLIDSSKYSIFDFDTSSTTNGEDRARDLNRQNNRSRFDQYIANFISTQVLAPAGIELLEGSVRGIHIGVNEITANNIAANTITANQIAANTITADQLVSNIVLVNNTIQSNIYTAGSAGWIIRNNGFAEFNNVTVRGTVAANAGNIGGWSINTANITSNTNNVILYNNGTIQGATIIGGTLISNTTTTGNRVEIASNELNLYSMDGQGGSRIRFHNNTSTWFGQIVGEGTGIQLKANNQTGGATFICGAASGFPEYQFWGYSSTIAVLSKNGSSGTTTLSVSNGLIGTQQVQLSGSSNGYYLENRSNSLQNWAMYVANDGGGTPYWRLYDGNDIVAIADGYFYAYNIGTGTGTDLVRDAFGQIMNKTSKRILKDNINYDISGLDILNKLKPASFIWKSTQENNYGFIAEDIAEADRVLSIFSPEKDENMSAEEKQLALENRESWVPSYYDEAGILAIAVKSIQELDAKIKGLEAKLGYTE
jgi:hypothetical protein